MTRTWGPLIALCAALTWAPVEAKVACFTIEESLALMPAGGVTLDGLIVQRSPTTGRYTADGGLDFDVNASEVTVVPLPLECTTTARELVLTTADPFAGPDAGNQTSTVARP